MVHLYLPLLHTTLVAVPVRLPMPSQVLPVIGNTKTVTPLCYGNTITTTKGYSMNELALEQITKATCLVCGDKLAPFELSNSICIMCED
jgi:hypothetical protein